MRDWSQWKIIHIDKKTTYNINIDAPIGTLGNDNGVINMLTDFNVSEIGGTGSAPDLPKRKKTKKEH